MEVLSLSQVDRIHDFLVDRGVDYEPLRVELLDHICCAVEEKMDCGGAFAEALEQSINDFGPKGLERTHEATIYLLTLKLRKMKKVAAIFGLIGGILTVLATLFKLMHWPGAGVMLVLGIATIVLMFLPVLLAVELSNSKGVWSRVTIAVGVLTAVLMGFAILFKVMRWPGGNVMIVSGAIFLGMIFMPLYFVRSYKMAENKLYRSSLAIVIFAGIFLFIGLTQLGGSKAFYQSMLSYMHRGYMMQEEFSENNVDYAEDLTLLPEAFEGRIGDLKEQSDAIYDHLCNLQFELIAATNRISVDEAKNINPEKVDWLYGTKEIQKLLFAENGEWSASELRKHMSEYQGYVLANYSEADQQLVTENMVFATLKGWESEDRRQSWEQANFSGRPLFYVISYLDMLKTETRHIESQVLMYLLGKRSVADQTPTVSTISGLEG